MDDSLLRTMFGAFVSGLLVVLGTALLTGPALAVTLPGGSFISGMSVALMNGSDDWYYPLVLHLIIGVPSGILGFAVGCVILSHFLG